MIPKTSETPSLYYTNAFEACMASTYYLVNETSILDIQSCLVPPSIHLTKQLYSSHPLSSPHALLPIIDNALHLKALMQALVLSSTSVAHAPSTVVAQCVCQGPLLLQF